MVVCFKSQRRGHLRKMLETWQIKMFKTKLRASGGDL